MSSYAIGIDLGGTNLRIAAIDDAGVLLEKVTTGTEVSRGRDAVLDEMCEQIGDVARKLSSRGTLAGIGLGVPGIIDMETGMLRESPNLPGWSNYPVRDEIEKRLKTHVFLENDANAAALGEHWLGAARDHGSMCMLTLGTGVGGGIVLDGRVWHGMNGMAGELGHIAVESEGHPCGCGSHGCIEQYASATAVVRMAREAVVSGEAPELQRVAESHNKEFSSRVVYQMALQGDRPAQAIFRRVGTALGILLAGLINGLNLPIYVIGGGVASAWEAFAPSMIAEVRRRSFVYVATAPDPDAPNPKRKTTIITRALIGSDAGLYGAARLPLLSTDPVAHQH